MSGRLKTLPRRVILTGDALEQLRQLPTASVDAVVTSPPYFRLRDYQVDGQIGLEQHVVDWVRELRRVMAEVARVVKPTGSVWLNLGDSFSRHPRHGAARKSLLAAPERVLLGLIGDGWIVRSKVIWAKSNTMPSSVADRLSCRWEVVYLLTRSQHYYFDLDAIREPHRSKGRTDPSNRRYPPVNAMPPSWAGPLAGSNSGLARLKAEGKVGHPLGKNPGDVWQLAAGNFRGAHFASFPKALITKPIVASVPERVCARCGLAWEREPARSVGHLAVLGQLRPACRCRKGWVPGVVLDPFFGAGTVGLVSEEHGRDWVGIELNPEFVTLATERITSARKGVMTKETNERRTA